MASVLVDTSVWVDYLRQGQTPASQELDFLLEENRVLLCGVVELELLQGVRPPERSTLTQLLEALSYVETEREDFQAAGELSQALRSRGIQVPSTDALIAAICLRRDFPLLTADRHFEHFHPLKRHKVS